MSPPIETNRRRPLLWLLAALLIGCLPAIWSRGVIERTSSLYHLAAAANPYFQPSHGWLLYAVTPLVAVSAFLFYLAPGGLLVLLFWRVKSAAEWIVLAFGTSILLSFILGTAVKLAGMALTPGLTLWPWAGAAGLAYAGLLFRPRQIASPMFEVPWREARRALSMAAAAAAAVAALVPKIFWESFNIDGIEAFEFGRSLGTHLFPFFELSEGLFGFYRNFVLFSYPNHWFLSLFGPIEASVRFPYVLYIIVVFAALLLLIEKGARRALRATEEAAIWLALACYTAVQVFNATYEPFYADVAESSATDTLILACFLPACFALWSQWRFWFWLFALFALLSSPGSLLLFLGLAGAIILARRENWRELLTPLAALLLTWAVITVVYEYFYGIKLLGGVNDQFSMKNMLRRLYPPTLTEWFRWNALLFPSGLLPALFLPAIRRADTIGWSLAVVTAAYFGVLYIQTWTSLHQFTPVMILPLVVFWRMYLGYTERTQRWLLPAAAGCAAISLALSLPRDFGINLAAREFGYATAYRVGDYEAGYPEAVRKGGALKALLPEDYRMRYPKQPWGTDPNVWIYYAMREKPPGTAINYVVQPKPDPAPVGASKILDENGVAVYVYDRAVWQRERDRKLVQVTQSPLYEPILRRTFKFFRDYTAQRQNSQKHDSKR